MTDTNLPEPSGEVTHGLSAITRGVRAMTGTWSNDDLVRGIERVEQALREMREEQRAASSALVPRESWDLSWQAYRDWQGVVGAQIVDVQADIARLQQTTEERFKAERTERITAVRWAVGIGVPTVLTIVGMVLSALIR